MTTGRSQDQTTDQAVLAAEQRRCAAFITTDIPQLEALLHDDLIFVHTNGLVQDKAALLETRRNGPFRYLRLDHSHVRVRTMGDMSVLTATIAMEMKNTALGTDIRLDARAMQVWRQVSGAWKLFAYQTTRITL